MGKKGTEKCDTTPVSDKLWVTAEAKTNMEPEERVLDLSGREIAGGPAESYGVQSMLGMLSEIQTLVERSNIINVSVDFSIENHVAFLKLPLLQSLHRANGFNCAHFVNNKKTKMVCFVYYFFSLIDEGVMLSLIFVYYTADRKAHKKNHVSFKVGLIKVPELRLQLCCLFWKQWSPWQHLQQYETPPIWASS